MSVFISYSSKDFGFVDKLSLELVKNKIHVWLDKWEMKPGDSLIDKIQTALTESSFLLVVLSKNSVESEWCKKELNSGLMRELSEKKVVIIPVLIEDCSIPLLLQEKVYADFRKSFDEGFKTLLKPLSKLFSEHMGRAKKDDTITDYCIDWGLEDDHFYLTIDLVNWIPKQNKSVLIQILLEGNDKATERHLNNTVHGMPWLMKEAIIAMMRNSKDFSELKILAQNNNVYRNRIISKDRTTEVLFYVTIRAVLMGEDNGDDILLHFIEFLDMLDGDRENRMKSERH